MKFNVKALALTCGILCGVGVFILGLIAKWFGIGAEIVPIIASGYKGFSATFAGAVIGGIWGFADGLVGGAIFAWLYNKLAKKK